MLCYVYVNCVLGYEHICYVNMLHVLSCTFLHENNISTKTNNTGYPALDPTANKYLSGSGWEIMIFCVVMFSCFSVFLFFSKLVLFVMFYMCFFDCKCKSLKRLCENIFKKENWKKYKTKKNSKKNI